MGDFIYGEELPAGGYGPGARDQRLQEFAQGRWGDVAAGTGWLALQAGDVSRPEVLGQATDDEVLGIGRAWRALESWSFAGKLAVARELIRRHPLHEYDEPGTAAGGLPADWDPRLYHEVAAALEVSLAAAAKLVGIAWTLEARLPGVGRALSDNKLDPGRVKMIVDATAVLESEDMFARAEQVILAGLAGCRTWSDLERLVQRAVITVDPRGAENRRTKAEREDARIRFWRESSGACGLAGIGLPTDEALAARGHVEARAREYQAVPIARPIDILRVMAYLDILNNVPVAQRAAWAQAEDQARQADAQATRAGQGQDQDPDDGELGNGGPDSPSDGPGDGGPGDSGPHDDGPAAGNPEDGRPGDGQADSPGDDWPDDNWPADDGDPGDRDDGIPPEDPCAGCEPGGPCKDWDLAEPPGDDSDDVDGGSGTTPAGGGPPRASPEDREGKDPPGQAASSGPRGDQCPECSGAGGVAGLPIKAALTIPAGALGWLAEWSAGAHDPGSGAGGGPGMGSHCRTAGACPACGAGGGGTSLPVREDLTVPLLTLLGLATRPGEAHGLGALDPAVIREMAAAGARHPGSQFCITVTDDHGHAIGHGCCKPLRGTAATGISLDRVSFTPSGGPGPDGGFGSWVLTLPGAPRPFIVDIDVVPVDECDHRHASAGYRPSEKLRHLIQVRDGKCSFPACSRHARDSDFEHATPYHQGGATCACNAHACSRSCHRVKQSPGWQVAKPRPGWTQWTTMAGRAYLQGPWRYPA